MYKQPENKSTQMWNHALALQRRYYRMYGRYVSCKRMKAHFAHRIHRELLHSQTVQEILERLDTAYLRFFKRLAKRSTKFPRAVEYATALGIIYRHCT